MACKAWALLLLFSIAAYQSSATDCVYTLYIRTAKVISGGTNSVISVFLYDSEGDSIQIDDIESWGGLMGSSHDYFERGNIDIFSGLGTCLGTGTICGLNLTSDGSGTHHGWYVDYLEATITGANLGCDNQYFDIDQWIATDASPYELYAIRDNCSSVRSRRAKQ